MHRFSSSAAAIFAAAVVATGLSCSRDVGQLPESPCAPQWQRVEISAALEQPSAGKTSLMEADDSGHRRVEWVKDDEIRVFWDQDTSITAKASASGESTRFTLDIPQTAKDLWAVYPSSAPVSFSGGVISVTIPSVQTGEFSSGNISVAKTDCDALAMSFFNAHSCIALTVTDPTITRAIVYGNNGEHIAGTIPVTVTDSGVTLGTPSDVSDTIAVETSSLNTYYISLLPGVEFKKGISVRLFKGGKLTGTVSSDESFTLSRAQMADVGSLDWISNRYVTMNGAGLKNGSSWENAWSKQQLEAFLFTPGPDADRVRQGCDELSFRVAAGTYVFTPGESGVAEISNSSLAAPVAFSILGGFPEAGGDTRSDVTAFSGAGSARILSVSDKTRITFDGLTFTDGVGQSSGRAPVVVDGPTVDVSFLGCTFKGNSNENTTGCVQVEGGSTVLFKNCTFSGNTALAGAGVNVAGTSTVCTISGCTFKDNTMTQNGSIKITDGTATVEDCIFRGNTATDGHAGAIWVTGAKDENSVNVRRCTFCGNQAKWGGAVYCNAAIDSAPGCAVFTDCTFGGDAQGDANRSSLAGACAAVDAGTLTFNNCTASGNVSSDRGGVFFATKGSIIVNGGTYSSNNAGYGGVAYAQTTGSIVFNDATLTANTATKCGGATCLVNGASIILDGCTVRNNSATTCGGAAQILGDPESVSSFTAKDTEFSINYCVNGGGAVRSTKEGSASDNKVNSQILLEGCTFKGNYASSGYGGCLDLRNSGTSLVKNCVFENNYTGISAAEGKGGAASLADGGMGGGRTTFTGCTFKGNHTLGSTSSYAGDNGGAVNVGGNGTAGQNDDFLVMIDGCLFDSNYATQGGALNVNGYGKLFMNACVFTANYITYRYGTTAYFAANSHVFLNNCTFADDTYSTTGGNNQCTWVNTKAAELVLSNNSLIGVTRKGTSKSSSKSSNPTLVRFDGVAGEHHFINNIIAPTTADCYAVWADKGVNITAVSNKTGELKITDASAVYGSSGKEANDFLGTDSYFGGLAFTPGKELKGYYWGWDGNILLGGDTGMDTLDNIKAAIRNAGGGFYEWLDSLGALNTDARGVQRSATTWPGSYQNSSL